MSSNYAFDNLESILGLSQRFKFRTHIPQIPSHAAIHRFQKFCKYDHSNNLTTPTRKILEINRARPALKMLQRKHD